MWILQSDWLIRLVKWWWWWQGFLFVYSDSVVVVCEFESPRWGVLDTTLCDKACQWLATGRWFSPGTPVSSTNKTERYYWNIVESGVKYHNPQRLLISASWLIKQSAFRHVAQLGHIILIPSTSYLLLLRT